MFYTEEIKLNEAADLLARCGLAVPRNVDYTAGVFVMETGAFSGGERKPVACGSLKGDMIQGVAVDPAFQGEDLTAMIMTCLFSAARSRGITSLYLFTRPEKAMQFEGLGFRTVAKARPYAALLEWGETGVKQYMDRLSALCRRNTAGRSCSLSRRDGQDSGSRDTEGTGVLVMNCNPFTKGHRYLIEYAAARNAQVYVLAVEEDVSLFSFADRMEMMKRGTADLSSVTVMPGGRYAVSDLTFPSYFTKEENLAAAHAAIDAELFAGCIAPALSADVRYVGTEPFSKITEVYNETLKQRLPKHDIAVEEIPRLCAGGGAVSASRVRAVLMDLHRNGRLTAENICSSAELSALLPETTLIYLQQDAVLGRLKAAIERGERKR